MDDGWTTVTDASEPSQYISTNAILMSQIVYSHDQSQASAPPLQSPMPRPHQSSTTRATASRPDNVCVSILSHRISIANTNLFIKPHVEIQGSSAARYCTPLTGSTGA